MSVTGSDRFGLGFKAKFFGLGHEGHGFSFSLGLVSRGLVGQTSG